ncbi:MAG: hypothetical protein L0Y57_12395 [Beijerinckiaceae bacterium]|nr:hypothetical protein [Beijerinckiaceae bacterium]
MGSPADADSTRKGGTARPQGPNVPAKAGPQGSKRGAGSSLVPLYETGKRGASQVPPLSSFAPHVALGICLFGLAWAAGSYFSGAQGPQRGGNSSPAEIAAKQEKAERSELLHSVHSMAGDVRALQAGLASLRAEQSQNERKFHGLEGVSIRLDAVKAETGAAMAGLTGKTERLQREQEAKLAQILERLDRLERKLTSSSAPVSSGIGPASAGTTQKNAQAAIETAKLPPDPSEGQRKPRLITNWVVRDVYGGIALLESPRGAIEVAPGEFVPGAGRVKSIERRGPGWIVITSQGLVDSARGGFMP